MLKTLGVLWLLVVSTGCYRYRAVETPPRGADVRARLHTEAAVRRSHGLDEPVLYYEGRVVGEAPESITLDVLVLRDPSQFRNVELRDTVTIARSELQSIMVRELSTSRSIVFAAALGAGAFAVVKGITAIVGGTDDDGPGNGPEAAVVPVLGLRLGSLGFTLQTSFR